MRRASMPSALFSAPDFKHHNPDFQDCDAKIGRIFLSFSVFGEYR